MTPDERLAQIGEPPSPWLTPAPETPALLAVFQILGQSQGFTVRRGEAEATRNTGVAAIATASGVRPRRVTLPVDWSGQDMGPLLGYRTDQQSPVALLPSPRGYRCFDPAAPGWKPADPAALATVAFTLTTPLQPATFSRELAIILLAGCAIALLALLPPAAMAMLLTQVIPAGDRTLFAQIAGGLAAAWLAGALFEAGQAITLLRWQTALALRFQTGVWDHLLRLHPRFFRRFTAGHLRLRAEGITHIQQLLPPAVLRTLLAGVVGLLGIVFLFTYSRPIALVTLMAVAFLALVTFGYARALLHAEAAQQESAGQLSGLLVQLLQAIAKLRVAGATERAYACWADAYADTQTRALRVRELSDGLRLTLAAVPPLATLAALWTSQGAELGVVLASLAAQGLLLTAFANLAETAASVTSVLAIWRRVRVILDESVELTAEGVPPGPLTGAVRVDRLGFRYRDDGPPTLEDISIEAKPGECIALVGPSGSGKSTLLQLLLRFENPASGSIYFDGQDLATLDAAAVRRQVGVVLQESKLLSGSILENILSGGLGTIDEAWDAARLAGLATDIEAMPMNMHTMVSEGGGNLSGGQRQRLLLARALIRKPKLFLFDEATSALDNRTQRIVTESLERLEATRIIVAHRLSTIRRADRIYVIDAGRVVQQGTFGQLAEVPGLFRDLMRHQVER